MKLILSLSGGGRRGILYSKLIPEIQKQHEIVGVYGVSIGAIIGFAIITKINLITLFDTREFKILLNLSDNGVNINLANYFNAEYRNNVFKNALLQLFKLAKVNVSTLFKDFSGLCVSACIQGKPNILYMSSICNNDIRVFDALYASACVPLLFEPFEYKGVRLFDAGVLENLIIPGTSINKSLTVNNTKFETQVIGIYLEPVQTCQWFIDALYTWQYLWNLKYAQNCMPVFVANNDNYTEILNFIKTEVKT